MNCVKELKIKSIIKQAFKEDIGRRDITTERFIPQNKQIKAILLAKEDCVVCGLKITRLVFEARDRNIRFKPEVLEGQKIKKGKIIAKLWGQARAILTAERVALNFLSFLSGIATKTREYVDKVKPYRAKIMDTRKTTPGLRNLEKYAVRVGGGYNHRFRLDEMVLVKDNHIKVAGRRLQAAGLRNIIEGIRKKIPRGIKLEIEVNNLIQFKDALGVKPDIIMLDNMRIKDIKKAVEIKKHSRLTTHDSGLKLEASGGINLNNVKKIAATGVDMISIGALTHSVKSVDMSLEVL